MTLLSPILPSLTLLFISTFVQSDSVKFSTIKSYSEAKVWQFINEVQLGVSPRCAKSLRHVIPMLTASSTLDQQRQFFYKSFASGDAEQLISLDMDRWFQRSIECLKVAGETIFSASDYPVHYCYASNHQPHSKAYGICIPSNCEQDRQILLHYFQKIASNGTDASALDTGDCTRSRHTKQWYQRPISMIHLSFDFVLSLLVVLGTIYDLKRGGIAKSIYGQFLIAFSYTRNCMQLARMPKDPKSTIRCMFGLRFLCMSWTLIGHSFYFAQSFIENFDDFKRDLVDNFWNQWISNFTLGVDVFFMLSGTLLAYSWFKKFPVENTPNYTQCFAENQSIEEGKSEDGLVINLTTRLQSKEVPSFTSVCYWLRFYRHRLIRLWPAYMYVLLGLTARLSITHWHPMFPATDPAVQCPKHWASNLFMFNSIVGNMCMPWTWYISCEFIFYLFAPLFLVGMHKNKRICSMLSVFTILLSSLANAWTMHLYNFPPTPLALKPSPLFNADFMQHHLTMYTKPWFRVGPYIVGLLLGHYLSDLARMEKPPKRSTKFMTMGWLFFFIGSFWAIFGVWPATQGYNWPVYHYTYGAFHRTIFATSFAFLVYACQTDRAKMLNIILGSRILLPLSSLSYAVYLVHLIAIAFTYMLEPFPMAFHSKWPLFGHCVVQLVLSYLIAGRVALVSELPVLNIERILKQWKRDVVKSVQDEEREKKQQTM